MWIPSSKKKWLCFLWSILIVLLFNARNSYALEPGDIAFLGFQSHPDKFAFLALVDIPEGTVINFTDKGWKTTSEFRTGEGITVWTSPVGGINIGQVVTMEGYSGINLSGSGDQILAFTGDVGSPLFIAGINTVSASWATEADDSNTSTIPTDLTDGLNCLSVPGEENGYYKGDILGLDKLFLLESINNPENWKTTSVDQPTVYSTIIYSGQNIVISGDVKVYNSYLNGSDCVVTIEKTASVNMEDNTLINHGTIIIEADSANSGALLLNSYDSASTGSVIIKRGVKANRWQFVGPAVEGQNVQSFLDNAGNAIPLSEDESYYAMRTYNNIGSAWNGYMHKTDLDGSEMFDVAEGVAFWKTSDGALQFEGTPVVDDINVPVSEQTWGWNFIANPYTCPIHIGDDGGSVTDFIEVNADKLVSYHQAVYVWHGLEKTYKAINNASTQNAVVINQAFMVRVTAGAEASGIDFTQDMKVIDNALSLKSNAVAWDYLTVKAETKNTSSTSTLAFNHNMSIGLDPSYDAAIMENEFAKTIVYSKSQDENVRFDIQSLPIAGLEETEIPIGIKAHESGQVTLSFSIPADLPYTLYVEDKSEHAQVTLTNETTLNVDVKEGYNDGRFAIVFKGSALDIPSNNIKGISARYAQNNIWIEGVDKPFNLDVFNVSGRKLGSYTSRQSGEPIPAALIPGIYILGVKNGSINQSVKVRVE